jgi:hypothetical protein
MSHCMLRVGCCIACWLQAACCIDGCCIDGWGQTLPIDFAPLHERDCELHMQLLRTVPGGHVAVTSVPAEPGPFRTCSTQSNTCTQSSVYAINPHAMQHGTWSTRSCRSAYNMCTRENAIVFPCDSIRRTGQHREALLSALIRATACALYVATMRQQWHATPHKHAYHTVHTIATHGTVRTVHEESVRS